MIAVKIVLDVPWILARDAYCKWAIKIVVKIAIPINSRNKIKRLSLQKKKILTTSMLYYYLYYLIAVLLSLLPH
jgi:hypothetical protein